jgi:hypothetical protein
MNGTKIPLYPYVLMARTEANEPLRFTLGSTFGIRYPLAVF